MKIAAKITNRLKVIASVEAETQALLDYFGDINRLKVIASVEAETDYTQRPGHADSSASRSLLPWRLRPDRKARAAICPYRLKVIASVEAETHHLDNLAENPRDRLKVIASVEAETFGCRRGQLRA